MDLKEFISASVAQIAEAILIADQALKPLGGMVNPGTHSPDLVAGKKFVAPRTTLNFDVALTAAKSGEAGAQVQAKILVFDASVGGKGATSSQMVSRLSFSLDVVLPHDKDQEMRVGMVRGPAPK